MKSKVNIPVGVALFAVLVMGLMFLLPGGLLQAQDNGPIMYAENGTGRCSDVHGGGPGG